MKNNKRKIYHILVLLQVIVLLGVSILPVAKSQLKGVLSSTDKETTKEEIVKNEDETTIAEANTAKEEQPEAANLSPEIEEKLNSMSLKEKVAQLFIISPEELTGADAVTLAGDATKEAIEKYPVGGLFYTALNMGTQNQVKDMLKNVQEYGKERIGLPMFLGVQEEGGGISPFDGNAEFNLEVEGAASIGADHDADLAYSAGTKMGTFLSKLGFNYTVGPIADVTKSNQSVTAGRTFGTDADVVSSMVSSEVMGLKEEGVSSVLKYFPGKGKAKETLEDKFESTSQKLSELEKEEFTVYENAIEAGADFVMVGHIVAEKLTGDKTPSSMSEKMITEVLRGDLGFDGIVMTESLSAGAIKANYSAAEAAVAVIKAGGDVIFLPEDFEKAYEGILKAVEDGEITEERINESVARVLKVKMGE